MDALAGSRVQSFSAPVVAAFRALTASLQGSASWSGSQRVIACAVATSLSSIGVAAALWLAVLYGRCRMIHHLVILLAILFYFYVLPLLQE